MLSLGHCVRRITSPALRSTTNIASKQWQKRTYAGFAANDKGPQFRHFLAVGLVGTMIFGLVVKRIDEQDSSSSLAKRKNSFSEEEWDAYLKTQQRTKMFEEGDFYLVPQGKNLKGVQDVIAKVSAEGSEPVVVDLNKLIKAQLEDPNSKYGTLLRQSFESEEPEAPGCEYKFNYTLAHGIFTQLVKRELETKKDSKVFVLLNYPNNIKEAIKFETDIATCTKLLVLDDDSKDDVIDYFQTVDKVIKADQL
ncbi:unnamed protein product [Kuraishia capsulata CBS 1993]|uniref:Altered inheritance of mitochondria protein 36, mitochondrial n=1 Tax=Kuraishia capsulata CBS 1993 TaxID=1382522 RepID=W6MSL3_9ASCO|nr:uncharacterized protein KUCA_T00004189001 [Kuraishia capsulata CBS 1993]CDK28207.1 unnamed protein product [Kuraishia capsulata CBS 1993]